MSSEFREIIRKSGKGLTTQQMDSLVRFRGLVLDENQRQNLTRLVEPARFWDGLLLDAVELIESGLVRYPAMDLGTGSGVPGLVCGLLTNDPWILVDSERRKTEFVTYATEELGASSTVRVAWGRIEDVLRDLSVNSIVAKAVGPIDRIYGWIRDRSTWNNLILLKGPAWDAEWAAFQAGKFGKELQITGSHSYHAGDRERRIVRLERAAR